MDFDVREAGRWASQPWGNQWTLIWEQQGGLCSHHRSSTLVRHCWPFWRFYIPYLAGRQCNRLVKSKLWHGDCLMVPLIPWVALTNSFRVHINIWGQALSHHPFAPNSLLPCLSILCILFWDSALMSLWMAIFPDAPFSQRHLISMDPLPAMVPLATEHSFCQDPGPRTLPTRWSLDAHGWIEHACSQFGNSMLLSLFAIMGT